MLFEHLEDRRILAGEHATLVSDLYLGATAAGSDPVNLAEMNGIVYFTATMPTTGRELWRSDGTPAGTRLVKDIRVGTQGMRADFDTSKLMNVGGTLYFSADDGVHGQELWRSDGTAAGTTLVKDIRPGKNPSGPTQLTNVGGTLFFSASDGVFGTELWQSDGTEVGTTLVTDIYPGPNGASPNYLVNVNGTLFFQANDGTNGEELWRSDGTGTTRVKDIWPNLQGSRPSWLANINGTLYFRADDGPLNELEGTGGHGVELWQSDGTEAGTELVKDINPGVANSTPLDFEEMNGLLYFLTGGQLWRSNGTEPGTFEVKEGVSAGQGLTNVGGTLFFRGFEAATGSELWRSDGTSEGTKPVKDICPGTGNSDINNPLNLNGTFFFQATDGQHNAELWRSDGLEAGTVMVKDIWLGVYPGKPTYLTNVNGTLMFRAWDDMRGNEWELWRSDGTEVGTTIVKDVRFVGSAYPNSLTNVSGSLFFGAFGEFEGVLGQGSWMSDGTAVGTQRVNDIYPMVSARPCNVNGTLFFVAYRDNNEELWRSDGATPLAEIWPGRAQHPHELTNLNGTLFLVAKDSANGIELWRSDGTKPGTIPVEDLRPGTLGSNPAELTNVGGTLYFQADDGSSGQELWRINASGDAELVEDAVADGGINPGSNASAPTGLTNVNGTLYFAATDGANGRELWRINASGQAEMVVPGGGIRPGSFGSSPEDLTNVNGVLYFEANDGVNGKELWRSDGTQAGTMLVKNIAAGSTYANLQFLTDVNGVVYFQADNGVNGPELWRSDGTEPGTVLVKDIFAGPTGSNLAELTNFNGALFFQANDGIAGDELWSSDGSEGGTALAKDIADNGGSNPSQLTVVGDDLFFIASTETDGVELWRFGVVDPTPVAEDDTLPETSEESPFTIPATILKANDTGSPLAVTGVSNSVGGAVSLTSGAITFAPSLHYNGLASFEYTVSDGVATDTGVAEFFIVPVNDAPRLTLSGQATYTENAPPLLFAAGAGVNDPDGIDWFSLSVSITAGANSQDRLGIRNQGTGPGQIGVIEDEVNGDKVTYEGDVIGYFSGGVGTTPLEVTCYAEIAAIRALVRNLTFERLGEISAANQKTITLVLSDGSSATSGPVGRTNAIYDLDTFSKKSITRRGEVS